MSLSINATSLRDGKTHQNPQEGADEGEFLSLRKCELLHPEVVTSLLLLSLVFFTAENIF